MAIWIFLEHRQTDIPTDDNIETLEHRQTNIPTDGNMET